jgi:hypothetical protein
MTLVVVAAFIVGTQHSSTLIIRLVVVAIGILLESKTMLYKLVPIVLFKTVRTRVKSCHKHKSQSIN